MRRLGLTDMGFLLAENRDTPMHVGGVSLYTLPKGADERTFLHELAAQLRNVDEFLPPLGDRLQMGRLGLAGPVSWEADPALDMDYHIRHSALPRPGRYRELFTLVSRLHTTLLDRNRPLWELHLIEGLQKRQFAVYTKVHHAAVDGMRATRPPPGTADLGCRARGRGASPAGRLRRDLGPSARSHRRGPCRPRAPPRVPD